jgi:hypothetical protein
MKTYLLIACTIITALNFQSCTQPEEIPMEKQATFDLIQDKILTTNCAVSGCHASEQDPSFIEHGLILTKGNAYANLLNKTPKNTSAREDGLQLVTPGSATKSLLYQKLLYDYGHANHTGKTYGSVMPLGSDLLSNGHINYVLQWIEGGAPETGSVAEVSLLSDNTPSQAVFSPLPKPAAGEGYQMTLGPFEVYPFFERELFFHKELGNKEPVYVNRYQIRMRPGSHHFILYGFRDDSRPPMSTTRDLRRKNGSLDFSTFASMQNHIFNFGGSESTEDYTFPDGTAVELPANASFDMNSHYFNKGEKPTTGEVNINLYTIPKEKVTKALKVLDLGNSNLNLPPNKKTVETRNFTFDRDVKIVMLFSHTHKLGEKFEIMVKGGSRDGQVVYSSANWEHPEKINYGKPLEIKAGEGLTSRITYNNFTDKTVRFGLTSDDEMGIIFGYYYEE